MAKTAEGITGRQGEAPLEYLWWILEWELTLRLFYLFFFFQVIFFSYLMHKCCNSDCYLSPWQRCLSLLSHTVSSPLTLTLNWSAKPCGSQQDAQNGHLHYLKLPPQSFWHFNSMHWSSRHRLPIYLVCLTVTFVLCYKIQPSNVGVVIKAAEVWKIAVALKINKVYNFRLL